MPKSVKFHANQRVDLDDIEIVAKDYAQDTVSALASRSLFDDAHRFFSGFRIEIADQAVYPGQFTIYNGVAAERGGLSLTNEDALNTARTVTLVGASTTFFVEIEYVETDTDTDSRAFWDPTVSNGGPPTPDGREFSIDVATRTTPDWQVVTPVSTVGFAVSSSPSTTRIPIARLTTNGSNEITAVTAQAASVFVQDYAPATTAVRLLSTVIFPDSGTVTLSSGLGVAETLTFTANDRANGILTLAVPTSNAHTAGSICVVSGGPSFLAERLLPEVDLGSDVDVREKMFQGSEIRGTVLQSSYRSAGARDDLQLSRLKDLIDFQAAQLRELKWGSTDPSVTSFAPPASFSATPRYYDRVGSVAGARSAAVTVGNGSTTFGDFNGTDETPFIAALAALPVTGGVIHVKAGTYTFANTVTVGKEVAFVGEGRDATVILSNVAGGPAFSVSQAASNDVCEFTRLTIDRGTGAIGIISFAGTGGRLHLNDCFILDTVECPVGVTFNVVAQGTSFTSTVSCFGTSATDVLTNSRFTNCAFSAPYLLIGGFSDVTVSNSTFGLGGLFAVQAVSDGLAIANSTITHSLSLCGTTVGATASNVQITNCNITTNATAASPALFYGLDDFYACSFTDNHVDATFTGTSSASPGELFYFGGSIASQIKVVNNQFNVNSGSFVDFVSVSSATGLQSSLFSGNALANVARLAYVANGGDASDTQFRDNVLDTILTGTAFDVCYFDTCSLQNVFITGNRVRAQTTSALLCGVHLDTPTVVDNLFVDGNSFELSSSSAHGFFCPSSLPATAKVSVSGNSFEVTGTTGTAYGVYLLNGTASVRAVNNTIAVACSSTGTSYGIYSAGKSVVANNRLPAVTSTGGVAVGIAAQNSVVYGNELGDVDANNASLTTFGIHDLGGCVVTSNLVDVSTTAGLNTGIYHTGGGGIQMQGNQVICGTLTQYGIYALPGAAITRLHLVGNQVIGLQRAGVAGGIEVVCLGIADQRFVIADNQIIENAFHELHRGIQIEAAGLVCDNVSITGNSIQGVTPTGARNASAGCGIRVSGVQNFNITANNVDWAGNNAFGVNGIVASQCNVGVINSNRITPSSSVSYDEILLATTDNVLIHGNYVGDGSITGSINIGGAANVTNTDNKTL